MLKNSLNKKVYIGEIEPNPKEFGIWIKEDGTTKIHDYIKGQWEGEDNDVTKEDDPLKHAWTGHADAKGLKAIGWTDEDIAYYQKYQVDWNEESDEYHKVPEENVALYYTLTAENVSEYKDKIVYLPKIDTSHITNMDGMFKDFENLLGIPLLDTSNVTSMNETFYNCDKLTCIPLLDTKNVTSMQDTFNSCALKTIPLLDTSNVTNMRGMFLSTSLHTLPKLNTGKVTDMWSMFIGSKITSLPRLDTKNVTDMSFWIEYNSSVTLIQQIDMSSVTSTGNMFDYCSNLQHIKIKGLRTSLKMTASSLLTKESLLYMINNESATSEITVTLNGTCYDNHVNDPDIVAALNNHPNITLAK